MTKPNFEEMTFKDLRAYVLEHRNDIEAIRALFSRRSPNAKTYGIPRTPEEWQEQEEAILQRIEKPKF
jgi:hypothetical protein